MSKPKPNPLSVRYICETFWALEAQYDLLNWQIDDVYIWPIIRMRIYYALVQQLGVFDNPHPEQHTSFFQKVGQGARVLKTLFTHNPYRKHAIAKHIIFPHPRKVKGEDIYSAQLRRELGDDALVIEEGSRPAAGHLTLDGYRLWQHLKMTFIKPFFHLQPKDIEKIASIERLLTEQLGASPAVTPILRHHLLKFRYYLPLYETCFRRKQTQKVYLGVGYGKPYIIAAAHAVGARAIEFQHGTITPYHLGYSYPQPSAVPYTADLLLTFGRYWADTTTLSTKTQPIVIGAPYVKQLGATADEKKPKSIVFVSQGVIGQRLFAFARDVAERLSDYSIYYNLHPSERLADYPQSLPANIQLVHQSPTIFELLAQCEYQVGVFSTTLFEGMVLGCKIILIDMPGIDYMQPVIERGDALLVKTAQELIAQLPYAKPVKNVEYYYAEPVEHIMEIVQ